MEIRSAGAKMNQKVTRNYLSLEELSQRTSLSVTTLRGYLKHPTHPLPHYRLPGKILVRPEEFDAWIQHYRCGAATADPDLDGIVNDIVRDIYSKPRKS
jgi:AraC-like DNA-binding protein